ncbi:unnamed protein product, partial [Tetraodon nigroviridis]
REESLPWQEKRGWEFQAWSIPVHRGTRISPLSRSEKGKRRHEGVKRRISKQMRYAVSKQRTMESGLTAALSALTGREKRKKRGDHHSY